MRFRRIVICGSMSNYHSLTKWKQRLIGSNVRAIVPREEPALSLHASHDDILELKRQASLRYFREIMRSETFGIMVINDEKRGIRNYIGANAFAEVSIAFTFRKKIYLLNDMYENYEEELEAWGAVALNRNLDRLIDDFISEMTSPQLPLL